MSNFPFTTTLASLPTTIPFVGPDTHERLSGIKFRARIGANENGFGPSPKAQQAMIDSITDVWKYGDSDNFSLRTALARHHDIPIENIVVGEGIDGLLGLVCRMFVSPGRNVVTTNGAYPTFNFQVTGNGGKLHFVDMKNDHEDLDSIVTKAAQTDAVLAYISNPNNPMGTWHEGDVLNRITSNIPQNTMMVLDEAYIEFAPQNTILPIDVTNRQLMRFRTFSKAYAMAGARIGYCIAHADLICEMEKLRNHFGVNRPAQFGALAALEDQEYLQGIVSAVNQGKSELGRIAAKHGLSAIKSATNFLSIDCGRDDKFARMIVQELGKVGIFIRMGWAPPQSRCIRVSVGTSQEHQWFDEALSNVLSNLQ